MPYDIFGQKEIPDIILCNPNKTALFSLKSAYDTKLTMKFNALSEFQFMYSQITDGGQTILPAFAYLQNKRLVLVEGYGYFQIVDARKTMDGSVPIMEVTCQSLECELIQKRVSAYGGDKFLYNITTPADTVLGDMLALIPTWSVGHIDVSLMTSSRRFNISDTNIYNLLMGEVAKAFECIFVFDTVAKTISAYTIENAQTSTDIFLSFNNVIAEAELSEKSDEITTCLSVFGDGNLNINVVNPLGTSKIYNFDYYKNTQWMTQSLVDAITAWEAVVDAQQPLYANELTALSIANAELLALESEMASLNEAYLAVEGVIKVRVQAGQPYPELVEQQDLIQVDIDLKEIEITNKEAQITVINSNLSTMNTAVSFSENFTADQLLELSSFIFENTYRNNNIIQTDIMTAEEKQVQAQKLYDQAQRVLARVSQPRYEFSLSSANYTAIQEFSMFSNQLVLGCIVTAEIEPDEYIQAVLLQMEVQFDDPSEFSTTFSNRLRLDDGKFTYSDLVGEIVKTGSDVSFDSSKWADWSYNYKDEVSTFITSALNTTTNNLISNSNQEILINQNGLRARESDGAGGYLPKQAWLVNNVLAFSDDGFQTSKLALGEVSLPSGGTAYGLVADVVVGTMLAGNTLTITNQGQNGTVNFILDGNGATLNNAKFTTQTTNTKIIIDPTSATSFSIQKNVSGTWTNQFWVDNAGNVNFTGNLTGATGTFSGTITANSGTIGGLTINSQGIQYNNNNYMRSDGTFKWGILTLSQSSGTFDGNVYARNLKDSSGNSVFPSGSTMSGSYIYGGTLGGSQGSIALSAQSNLAITGSQAVVIGAGHGAIAVANIVQLVGDSISISGDTSVVGSLSATSIYQSGSYVATQTWVISQGYYNSGDAMNASSMNATSYSVQNIAGVSFKTVSFRDYYNVLHTLTVRGGLVTAWA